MDNNKIMNILLSFDDNDWIYTRHAAVTILSLLETNKKNKIKIYIMSSSLPQENIDELKRIVKLYNQEIEFIICADIVPEELKKVIINKREDMRWPRYRYFFPNHIKWIDRILYMDCDVLVMKDISELYNMDMYWKSIAACNDTRPYYSEKHRKEFWLKQYINSGVLLFDVKKYELTKISIKKMKEINERYSQYFRGRDQDKINIIFENDFFVTDKEWFNYQISNKRFNFWIKNAEIVHCTQKAYVEYGCIPTRYKKLYNKYLNMSKRKWYPEKKYNYGYLHHLYDFSYFFFFSLFWIIIWKLTWKHYH